MIQVWKIDEYGFYIFETDYVEEPNEFEITTPCNTCEENTFYKPKWTGETWVEGATQEEIDDINKIDICPPKTVEERLAEAEQKLAESEEEKKLLKAQVEVLSNTTDFHEELIAEMASKVYA